MKIIDFAVFRLFNRSQKECESIVIQIKILFKLHKKKLVQKSQVL